MSDPTFARSAGASDLYWLGEAALPAGAGVALVLAGGGGSPPTSFDLAHSWTTYPGVYVIAGKRPATADEPAFVTAVRGWCAWLGAGARFLWLTDATAPPETWTPSTMWVAQATGATTATVMTPVRLIHGAYQAIVASGVTIALAADGGGFTLAGTAPCAWLSTPDDQWVMTMPASGPAMPFTGAAAGCVCLDLALPQDVHATGRDDYDRLDVGMRVAFDVPPLEGAPDVAGGGLLQSLRYPVFTAVASGGVTLRGRFDPSRPLDATRTRLAYATAAAHDSHYRGPLGSAVGLTPDVTAAASLPPGLALHQRPGARDGLPTDDPYYLAPIGAFTAALAGSPPSLACGISGYEYVTVLEPSAATITYVPSQPACASPPVANQPSLTAVATCPYAALTAAAANQLTYYAQPQGSALHRVRTSSSAPASLVPYLEFVAVPAPSGGGSIADPYPLFPYAGLGGGDLADATALEQRVLSPLRRNTLAGPSAALTALTACAPAAATTLADPAAVQATTPRGLLATFDPTLTTWSTLQLVDGDAAAPPSLALRTLGPDLRGALLSNQIFLVIGDPTRFTQQCDLSYWVTDAVLRDLTALPDAQRPPAAILDALAARGRTLQPGAQAFITYLGTLGLPPGWQTYQAVIVQYAAFFEIEIASWRFRLSPLLWTVNADPDQPVLMVWKFASSSMRTLVADRNAWTWPAAATIGDDPDKARQVLQQIIDKADAQVAAATDGNPSPLAFFVDTVVDDPGWCGVLFFNAPVPLDDLPAELRGLAGGIDASKFRAHHVGVSLSPVVVDTTTRTLALGPTPLFGLIDYEDPVDLASAAGDGDFDFKVLQLRVRFANSAIVDFASRIELYVAAWLGAPVVLLDSEHGNNLVLDGSYQRTATGGHYVFMRRTASRFESSSNVVDSVEITLAQFTTLAGTSPTSTTVTSRFSLWGRLRFDLLDGIDVFSFGPEADGPGGPGADGYLAFAGLAVDMTFATSDPHGTRELAVVLDGIAFDASQSVARDDSLFRRFPLQLAGMATAPPGTRPTDRGFLTVRSALYQPALDQGWCGLLFRIDLGTLGALAADTGLVVTLLAAWAPGSDRAGVNLGLQLPGVQSIGQLLPIEGVLDLGFRELSLDSTAAPDGGAAYALSLRRFYLRLLGWSFPPGQADIYLFADPSIATQPAGGRRTGLGWYAAYKKKG